MSLKGKKRAYKRLQRYYANKVRNRMRPNLEKAWAAKGKSKHCWQCPASLICNSDVPPMRTVRCKRCNVTTAYWGVPDAWNYGNGKIREVRGVRRCPFSRILVGQCQDCADVFRDNLSIGVVLNDFTTPDRSSSGA
jgi:hypothetical protein